MTMDRVNTAIVTFAIAVVAIALVWAAALTNMRADDLRSDKEHTEQIRIQKCGSIEDEAIRALCINARETP